MALPIRSALRSASRFVVRNPFSMLTVAKHAANMRVAVPLDALRWFITNTPPSKNAPSDVTITARPPAIQIGATIELMGSRLRAATTIHVEELRVALGAAALSAVYVSYLLLERNVFAGSRGGVAVFSFESNLLDSCNLYWDNEAGDAPDPAPLSEGPLWTLIMLVAVGLIAVEWATYHRRKTV